VARAGGTAPSQKLERAPHRVVEPDGGGGGGGGEFEKRDVVLGRKESGARNRHRPDAGELSPSDLFSLKRTFQAEGSGMSVDESIIDFSGSAPMAGLLITAGRRARPVRWLIQQGVVQPGCAQAMKPTMSAEGPTTSNRNGEGS